MRTLAATTLLLALALAAPAARAQELDTTVGVLSGSGISLGRGGGDLIKKRSPIFLDLDVGLMFDGDRSLEWTLRLLMELEGAVSVGVAPSVKKVVRINRRLNLYGGLGFPFFFAPFTLLGVEPAVGATFRFASRFSVVLEAHADVFFVGSDLPDGSVLAKMDLALGIRFEL